MEKVSIIIPAYNKAELTVKTVDSVLNQTYPNVEVIVVDDGSTDNTKQAMAAYGNRVKYFYKENGGACSARNYGLKNAQGEYIGFLDCDDVYEPAKVEEAVSYLMKNPRFGFLHTAAAFIDEQDRVVGHYSHPKSVYEGKIANRLILGNYICNSTSLIRRGCLEKVGGFDESIFIPADWDLSLRLAREFEAGYIDKPLTRYRVTGNYTFNNLSKAHDEEFKVINKFFDLSGDNRGLLKNKAFSNFYFRYAECFLLRGEYPQAQDYLRRSLKFNLFNLKSIILRVWSLIARQSLIGQLKKRILRVAE
jgi:glycosyltransferase involved in cell wall biosynthesis